MYRHTYGIFGIYMFPDILVFGTKHPDCISLFIHVLGGFSHLKEQVSFCNP